MEAAARPKGGERETVWERGETRPTRAESPTRGGGTVTETVSVNSASPEGHAQIIRVRGLLWLFGVAMML